MEKMEAMDFERFFDYRPDEILYRSIQYMWDLEDYEEVFRYLSFRRTGPTADTGKPELFYSCA